MYLKSDKDGFLVGRGGKDALEIALENTEYIKKKIDRLPAPTTRAKRTQLTKTTARNTRTPRSKIKVPDTKIRLELPKSTRKRDDKGRFVSDFMPKTKTQRKLEQNGQLSLKETKEINKNIKKLVNKSTKPSLSSGLLGGGGLGLGLGRRGKMGRFGRLGKLGKLGKFAKFGKRLPIIGGLLGLMSVGSELSYLNSEPKLTNNQKAKKTSGIFGGALGGMGGAYAGATAGAAIGSIVPGIGTVIGGVLGAVLGGISGEKAGKQIGEWLHDLNWQEVPKTADKYLGSASSWIKSGWDTVKTGFNTSSEFIKTRFGEGVKFFEEKTGFSFSKFDKEIDNFGMKVSDWFSKASSWFSANIATPVMDNIGKGLSWANEKIVQPVVETAKKGGNVINDGVEKVTGVNVKETVKNGAAAVTDFMGGFTASMNKEFKNIGYKMGGKNLKNGEIDCSGWVNVVQQRTIDGINKEFGDGTIPAKQKQEMKKVADQGGAAGIVKYASEQGLMVKNNDITYDMLKDGMVMGSGRSTNHANGRWNNIGHVVTVFTDPKTGKKMISESSPDNLSNDKGVRVRDAQEYIDSEKKMRGKDSSRVTILADPYNKNRSQWGDKTSFAPNQKAMASGYNKGSYVGSKLANGHKGWQSAKGHFLKAAEQANVDPGILAKIAYLESANTFNPNVRPISKNSAKNKVSQFDGVMAMSSAHGYGQFTDATWTETLKKYGSKYGVNTSKWGDPSKKETQTLANKYRKDPQLQAYMLAEFTKDNIARAKKLGGATDDAANVYALHNLGQGNAARFFKALKANPNMKMADVDLINKNAVLSGNRVLYGKNGSRTVAESYQEMIKLMNNGQDFAKEAQYLSNQKANTVVVNTQKMIVPNPTSKTASVQNVPPTKVSALSAPVVNTTKDSDINQSSPSQTLVAQSPRSELGRRVGNESIAWIVSGGLGIRHG